MLSTIEMCHHFAGTQTVWISDGYYSVHMMAACDIDTAVNENERKESEEKLMQISGFHDTIIFCLLRILMYLRFRHLEKYLLICLPMVCICFAIQHLLSI